MGQAGGQEALNRAVVRFAWAVVVFGVAVLLNLVLLLVKVYG